MGKKSSAIIEDKTPISDFDFEEELGQWPLDDIPRIAIVGKSGSGKSRLAIKCARHMAPRFGNVILISCNQRRQNPIFGKAIPTITTYKEPTEALIASIMADQDRMIDHPDKVYTDYETTLLLILDDVGAYQKVMKSATMEQLFCNGRQKRIAVILTAQYFNQLPPPVRTNVQYYFAFQEDSKRNMTKLHEEFFGAIGTKNDLDDALGEFTTDRGFLVAKNKTTKSNDLSEKIFCGRCTLEEVTPDYQIGSPFLWLCEKYYSLTEEEVREKYARENNPDLVANTTMVAPKSTSRFVKAAPSSKSKNGRSPKSAVSTGVTADSFTGQNERSAPYTNSSGSSIAADIKSNASQRSGIPRTANIAPTGLDSHSGAHAPVGVTQAPYGAPRVIDGYAATMSARSYRNSPLGARPQTSLTATPPTALHQHQAYLQNLQQYPQQPVYTHNPASRTPRGIAPPPTMYHSAYAPPNATFQSVRPMGEIGYRPPSGYSSGYR